MQQRLSVTDSWASAETPGRDAQTKPELQNLKLIKSQLGSVLKIQTKALNFGQNHLKHKKQILPVART